MNDALLLRKILWVSEPGISAEHTAIDAKMNNPVTWTDNVALEIISNALDRFDGVYAQSEFA